jgi:DNA adenine methylase
VASSDASQGSSEAQNPQEILASVFSRAANRLTVPHIADAEAQQRIEYVSRNLQNRAGVRLLMSCLLAKIDNPQVDVRKPYTEIGTPDAFSGRTYDERYIAPFIIEHQLPCNLTTAYLTPALRNRNMPLTPDMNLVGRPPIIYQYVLYLLTDVYEQRISADDALAETVRCLIVLRDEQRARMESLLAQFQIGDETAPVSAEGIVTLVEQHLRLPRTSRLPVLVVTAAYQTAAANLGEHALTLYAHNAADRQTGALGDVEIALLTDDEIITCYEMKDKRLTRNDLDSALAKLATFSQTHNRRPDNYIFITTEVIDQDVLEHAKTLYEKTSGVEFAVLDCIGFLRHYLHLFYRLRMRFLEAYQRLLLAEPDSAVNQPLKEAWLAMRRVAESTSSDNE